MFIVKLYKCNSVCIIDIMNSNIYVLVMQCNILMLQYRSRCYVIDEYRYSSIV